MLKRTREETSSVAIFEDYVDGLGAIETPLGFGSNCENDASLAGVF